MPLTFRPKKNYYAQQVSSIKKKIINNNKQSNKVFLKPYLNTQDILHNTPFSKMSFSHFHFRTVQLHPDLIPGFEPSNGRVHVGSSIQPASPVQPAIQRQPN